MIPLAFIREIPNAEGIAAIALVIFLAIGVHEYAHAKFADMAGDPTPRYFGRVTLDLTKHFEVIGTIMIVITSLAGVGIGWGKPVPMDPRKMRDPRWDHFVAVAAGPLSNLIQAIIFSALWKLLIPATPQGLNLFEVIMGREGFLTAFLFLGITTNLALCFFNLIPLGPLDGMWLLGTFLQEKARYNWTSWNLRIGQFVFLGLVLLSQLGPVNFIGLLIIVPMTTVFRILTGTPLF